MRQPALAVSVKDHVLYTHLHARFKTVTQPPHMLCALGHLFHRQSRSSPEGHDSGDRFSPGATLALLMAAYYLLYEAHAASNKERAHALRRIELMSGEREQVAAQRFNVSRHASGSLHRVRMKPQMTTASSAE